MLGSVYDRIHYLRRKCSFVLLSNHIRRRDIAPSCMSLRARVHPEALVSKLRSPLVCFVRGKIIVEYFLCVFRVNIDDALLYDQDLLNQHSETRDSVVVDVQKLVGLERTCMSSFIHSGICCPLTVGCKPSGIANAMINTSLTTPPLRPLS